jgi:hypothetical protein
MKKILTLFSLLLFVASFNAQILVEENFDYPVGDSLTQHGWLAHSAAGIVPIKVIEGNLIYPNYPLSGIGNMVQVIGGSGSREDVNLPFSPVTEGSVYVSFLVNVDTASTTSDYFFNVGPNPIATSFRGRVSLKHNSTGKFNFGLSQSSSNPAFTTETYDYKTTYLLVVEYEFVPNAADNDTVRLYINPVLGGTKPQADLSYVYTLTAADLQNVGAVALRQGSNAYSLKVDGLKVTTQWSDIIPVELTSFNAVSTGKNINISWSTATETNNLGFELYRNNSKITFVKGKGTTTEKQNYSYSDMNLKPGKYLYQLYQIDFDGTKTLVASAETEVNVTPVDFGLSQNYPNPFNPSTNISFSLPKATNVKITVYNAIGKEIAVLVNGNYEAGTHNITWNANNLASGLYFYKMEAENFTATKKMMLIR